MVLYIIFGMLFKGLSGVTKRGIESDHCCGKCRVCVALCNSCNKEKKTISDGHRVANFVFSLERKCSQPIRTCLYLDQAAVFSGWNLVLHHLVPAARHTSLSRQCLTGALMFGFFLTGPMTPEVDNTPPAPRRVWETSGIALPLGSAQPRAHALALPVKTSRGPSLRTVG